MTKIHKGFIILTLMTIAACTSSRKMAVAPAPASVTPAEAPVPPAPTAKPTPARRLEKTPEKLYVK